MTRIKARLVLTAGLLGIALHASPLLAQTATTGVFPNATLIEKQLRRGISTKADVQRLLGVPNGTGRSETARLAASGSLALGAGPREIWYYDDIEVTDTKSGDGAVIMKERQQILLVFFKADIFDGYLWSSNALTSTADR